MAIEAELADGRILEFPDGTDPKVIQDTVQRVMANPLAGMTTEKLKAIPSAPSTLRDLNETAAMSLAGGIKGLSDLFGVDNTVSKYFGEKQTQALKQMTPERLREMQIEEELAKRAEGNPLEEFTTAGRAFLRSPAQGLVGGAMSSVPMIAATALAPAVTLPAAVTARLGTGIAGRIAGKAAAASPAIAVGAGMGVGSQKGQDYEAVKKAMMDSGASEEDAEAAAQKAAEYSMQNAARQAASGIAGGLEGAIGVESVLGRMGRGRAGVDGSMTAPTWKGAAVQSTLGEAIPEAVQAATGAVGTNVALQQAGFDRDLTAGVIGQVTNDALTGALLGTAVTPLQKSSLQAEFDRSQLERQLKEDQERQEKIDTVREQLGVDRQLLALPAPAQRIEEPPVTDVLNAPFGSFARNELPPEVVKYIDDHRAQMGRPGALPAYSIEDIKDAMPGINPEGEAAYIDSLLTAKSGYTGDITYNPKTVMDVAGQKNVATGTKGFADFLTRVTGVGDLNGMSQPQLHAAFTALTNLPNPEEGSTQTILPEGTNALRFSDDQFMRGYTAVLDEIAASPKNEVSPAQAIEAIKAASGIQNDADAKRVFDLSLKGGAIDVNKEGNVTAPAGLESLPAGYEVREGTFKQGEQQEYAINAGERPLEGIPTFSDTQQALEKLATLEVQRQKQAELADKKIEALEKKIQESQENLEGMEAAGEANTQEYKVADATHEGLTWELVGKIATLQTRRDKLLQPLSIQPAGMKMVTRQGFTVFENGAPKATFPTKDAAIDSVVLGLPDERLNEAAAGKLPSQRTVARKAKQELDRRQGKAEPGIKVKAAEPVQKTVVPKEVAEKTKQMAEVLNKALKKFGLEDVGLKIIAGMQDEGSYAGRLIKIALDAESPIGVLRHESIHALKDMGFFTPQQWSALERMAKTKWIDQYLRQRNINGDPLQPGEQSRFDAYVDIYGGNMNDVIEEAIADAFRDFDVNKAPPGMLTALLKRMKDFFEALGNALRGLGYQTAEDIFGKVEAGLLKAGKAEEGAPEKLSLSGAGVPMSTRSLMEVQTPIAQQELGLNTEAVRNRFNNVRDIATALNQYTLDQIGAMDRNNLTQQDSTRIAKAIADEVAFQLNVSAKTGTGLGWYSNNYPKAVKRLANRFPELGTSKHARSVFSAIVAVTSNGERVAKNIDNAIKLYADLRAGKPLVAMGNRRATALENNLAVIESLLAEHKQDFEKVLLKEITVKEMNARLREMGEEADGSYLANTVVPAAAVYFGPKLGAFYANLSGSEGYLTMDLWWTRSINRMRGLLMPKATEASINKFRDMMDRPDATRDEVVAATIPLRNKYEEYGWNTELEHMVGSKEPSKKDQKPKWFKQAEKAAGDAYEQLLFDHNAEKMANTIYKNEFEMLEEAPFTATDRKFMYDAARKAQDMLRKEGIDLTLADIQAALWYYEKRLYEKLSGRKADDIGYEEAIIAQANQGNGRARPSVVFDQQPSGGVEPAGTSAEADEVGGQPATSQEKLSLRTVGLSDKRIDRLIDTYIYTQNDAEKKTKAYIAFVSPKDFLNATVSPEYKETLEFENKPLNIEQLTEFKQPIYLSVKPTEGRKHELSITGHEGRHRMMALRDAGYENVPVVFEFSSGENREPVDDLYIHAQKFNEGRRGTSGFTAYDLLPINYENRNAIKQKFSEGDIKYSLRTPPKSPEFQAWIARSKMVDKDGNPQVWYHGTARNISIFRPKQAASIFLTQDPDFAAGFSEDSLNWMAKNATDELTAEQKAQAIDDAVAKVQKDYDFVQKDDPDYRKLTKQKNDVISELENNSFSNRKMGDEAKDYLIQASKKYFPSGPNIMPLYVRALKPFDYKNKEHLDMVMRYLPLPKSGGISEQATKEARELRVPTEYTEAKIKAMRSHLSRGLWKKIESDEVQKAIRALGFDGYFIEENGIKNLAVYSPAQVASATGNIGAFKQRTPTFDEALNLGMTQEEAIEAQKAGDIRLSLRGKKIDKDMQASVDRVTYAREEKGWIKSFTDALSNTSLRQAFVDRYDTIYENTKRVAASKGEAQLFADVSAHSAAILSDQAAGVAAQALGLNNRSGGIPIYKNGGTFIFNDNGKIKGLLEILKPLAAYGDPRVYRYYQTWAGAKRGSRYDKKGVLTPYTADDFKQAAKFEKEFPEFVDIQKEWDTYNRGLVKYMIDTGVIDRAKGEEWMKHGDYLPFYRQLDDQAAIGPKVFQALSGVKGPKKLKGSGDPLGDFMENMVRNTQAAIESGMKNVAAQRVVRDALFLNEAKKMEGPFKADINTVSVLENGKQVNYQLADAMLAEAMKGLRMAEIPFLAIAAAPANLLRSVVTKMPDFIGANLMRDSLSAYVTSGAKLTPVIDTIRNFGAAIADKSPTLDTLRSYGVIGGYDLAQNVEKSGKDLAKDLRKKTGTRTKKEKILSATGIVPLWETLEKGSAASDAATRMAVFEATMKETGNEVEAAFRAMEVMNFSRKGNSAVIRILTAITPFLNARIQGLDVLYRAGIRPILRGATPTEQEKAIAKSFYIRGMTLASLSVMYYMLTHDDDDYKKQEQETRDNNWLIPSLGIKIPIPFEVGVIFKVVPERITAYMLGNDTGQDLMQSAKRNLTSTFGIQPPQAILPVLETITNYSFFTGREIVGQGMQDIDKQFQVNPNTTKLAQAIGNLTSFKTATGKSWGVSPIEIDHLISGYLGGMGMYMAESIDMIIDMNSDIPKASKRFEQMPVIKRFALDPKARGSVTAYYDLKNAVDETVRTDNYLTRTMKMDAKGEYMQDYAGLLLTKDYVNSLEKSMKEFREMKTMIQNSPMSADDKRDALSAVIDAENSLTANIKEIKKVIQ